MYKEPTLQSPYQANALDHLGNQIYVYDLIKVIKIPDFYLNEPVEKNSNLIEILNSYVGCYGLVKYNKMLNTDNVIRWLDKNNMFLVDVIKCADDCINVFDFCLPFDCVEKVEFNFLLYSVFSDFQFPITRKSYDEINDIKNIMNFRLIESILTSSFEELNGIQKYINSKLPRIFG